MKEFASITAYSHPRIVVLDDMAGQTKRTTLEELFHIIYSLKVAGMLKKKVTALIFGAFFL